MPQLLFEDLVVGQRVAHAVTRTLTETDNLLASTLIMSSEPLQLSADFAAQHSPSGERLFNSVFTLGLMIGISGHDIAYADPDAGFRSASFPAAARVGDTIRVETDVLELHPGVARLRHRALTHHGDVVAIAERNAPVRSGDRP